MSETWSIMSDCDYSRDELEEIGVVEEDRDYLIVTVASEGREYWMERYDCDSWRLSHTWKAFTLEVR